MTDVTGTKFARSGYDALGAEIYAGIQHLGDGLRQGTTHSQVAPGNPLLRMGGELPTRAPLPSEPQYASMASGAGAGVSPYATPWWGVPAPASCSSQMAGPWWSFQPYPSQGQQVTQPPRQQVKAKAKAKGQAKTGSGNAVAPCTVPASAPTPKTAQDTFSSDTATTVMLRNIPNRYTQSMLLELLDSHGFVGRYDFVYLPMDFRNAVNLGYAFVNLLDHSCALELMRNFHGYAAWLYESTKVCEVSWAHPHQGLSDHVERYRNSPVMHPGMPDEYKPMVFQDGQRVPFPTPTKAIRAPKLRPVRDRAAAEGHPEE